MKRLVILGSTGSIGTQVLDVMRRLPDRFEIVGLSANNNTGLLAEQANAFGAKIVSITNAARAEEVRAALRSGGRNLKVVSGVEGMCEVATQPQADLVVVAVAGAIGIAPTHAALSAGKDIALASKEVLVAAGEATMALAKSRGAAILPIDSEHSAIFQCLQGSLEDSIERILLTASGGPFRTTPIKDLAAVTPEQALRHPTWNMGGLVTINSATLMNKALEIIEARWLFDVPVEHVDVVIHPQSIVHSMVRFRDGSTLAQLGLPDMRLPIQYALLYPERVDTGLPRMEIQDFAGLTFEAPDLAKFPSLGLARRAVEQGGTMPAVMNAANEAAVGLFLERRISFPEIIRRIEGTMDRHDPLPSTLSNVLETDAWARRQVQESAT
ncbi:MAG TPA: 1-deoxy-D-xylulose-5-phosphate reductoisomerase [Chthonomonadaceae bacterium]|nr:1-deoxy-D-xylulose-5-phosphate reductoisomerase [Chthonomonadaceae bacterium]